MNEKTAAGRAGLALVCDPDGKIESVLADELGLDSRFSPGTLLRDAVHPRSAVQVERFVAELVERGRAFGVTVAVPARRGFLELRCHGVARGGEVYVVAEEAGCERLQAELEEIHRQRMLEQRQAQNGAGGEVSPPEIDPYLFEDLSRLNNEFANLQRAMVKKRAQLERINEEKNQLLGMAAHDLRNPLGVITNYGYYLKEVLGEALDDSQRQMLTMIEANSRFMVELIDDLLELVKFESGVLRLEPKPTDLPELVRHNLALNGVLAAAKQMRLEADIERRLPPVLIDRSKFEQVLNNLISNAIKYSFPESLIVVRLRLDESGEKIVLQVADQGQGIPDDELGSLFKPFHRTSVRTTGGEKSTGLGLAIVKRIIDGHQGRISVASEVGKGTTFTVELPLEDAANDEHAAAGTAD